jgi:hypothetical protein
MIVLFALKPSYRQVAEFESYFRGIIHNLPLASMASNLKKIEHV